MLWLIVAIFAYFILAVIYLFDKYLLKKSIPNPKVFAFYVGILGSLAFAVIPFIRFYIPDTKQVILSLLAGGFFIYGLFWFYKGLRLFEASRIVPAIGGLSPLFSFGLIYLFSFGKETLSFSESIAFVLLICGSIIITLEKDELFNLNPIKAVKDGGKKQKRDVFNNGIESFKISTIAAFLFSLSFVLTKYVFLSQPFWNGFVWIKVGGLLTAFIFFLFVPEIKREIFRKKISPNKKTAIIFLSSQVAGAGAGILQSWAIALAPLIFVAFISALQGVQYVFLFILTIFLSLKFPKILKEEISRKVIFQKIFAILSICLGLAILVLK